MDNYYNIINETMEEMLSYFSKLYSEHDAQLQEYNAKLFEVSVKLDELTRTQNVYSLNTDYRKNVFSPIEFVPEESEKESEIKAEILNLKTKRNQYEYDINEQTIYLKSIDKRIQKLNASKVALGELMLEVDNKDSIIKEKEEAAKTAVEKHEEQKLQKEKEIEEKNKNSISIDEMKKHFKNIMMIESFDNTYYSTVLDKRIKNNIYRNSSKLESVNGIISSDPGKSKMLINEVITSDNSMISVIDEQLRRMNYNIDEKKKFDDSIRDYIQELSEKHPEVIIDINIDGVKRKPDFVLYSYIYKLLEIFFDNIYKHSEAKHASLSISEENGKFEIDISDDGIGIKKNYLSDAEWYSGIHRAKELLFILSGDMVIKNSNGTKVKINFEYE